MLLLLCICSLALQAAAQSAEEVSRVALKGPLSKNKYTGNVNGSSSGLIRVLEGLELDAASKIVASDLGMVRLGSKAVLQNGSFISVASFSQLDVLMHSARYPVALNMTASSIKALARYAHIKIKWTVVMTNSHVRLDGAVVNDVGAPVFDYNRNLYPDEEPFETVSKAKLFVGGHVVLEQANLRLARSAKAFVYTSGYLVNAAINLEPHAHLLLNTRRFVNDQKSFSIHGNNIDLDEHARMRINNTDVFVMKNAGSVKLGVRANFEVDAAKLFINQRLNIEEDASLIISSIEQLVCHVNAPVRLERGRKVVISENNYKVAVPGINCNIHVGPLSATFLARPLPI